MSKIVRLTESELVKMIKKTLQEQTPKIPTTTILSKGDFGPEVIKLQTKLLNLINSENLSATLGNTGRNKNGIDGAFGGKTKNVLQTLQKKYGLTPNGEYDMKTSNLIDSLVSKSGKSVFNDPFNTKSKETKPVNKEKPIEKPKPVKQYKYSPRIDAELEYIKKRYSKIKDYNDSSVSKLWKDKPEQLTGFGKPFFIYDPKYNLIYLFDENYNYVASTSVVDGADVQNNTSDAKPLTIEEWCKISGLESSPHKCTDPSTKNFKKPYYSVLANLKNRFIPKGIYKISYLSREEGYTGKGKNVFSLKDNQGKDISTAIHGVPNLPERLKASAELETKLKTDINNGQVPEEYLNAIKDIANANQSFGCIGVPAKFIENPKVISKVKEGCAVFVIGENETNFLVQNSDDFFKNLNSDGQNCKSPESLASRMQNTA
jgi:peptidoglycan hydrolase-like protein with peptidoglycan-binding domain